MAEIVDTSSIESPAISFNYNGITTKYLNGNGDIKLAPGDDYQERVGDDIQRVSLHCSGLSVNNVTYVVTRKAAFDSATWTTLRGPERGQITITGQEKGREVTGVFTQQDNLE